MGVGEIDVDVVGRLSRQFYPQRANTRAGIEDEAPAPGGDLQTRRIAAIANVFRAGARNRSPYAPEADFQTFDQSTLPTEYFARVHTEVRPVNRGARSLHLGHILA